MATQKTNVEIFFKIDGLDAYVSDLETLNKTLENVAEATKEVSDEQKETASGQGKLAKGWSVIKSKGGSALKAIKTGIAATGIGLLIAAFGQLVAFFAESDTGAKIFKGTAAALGVIFERIVNLVSPLGEKISKVFSDPKQALFDFANAFKEEIIQRFQSFVDGLGLIGTAIQKVFSGDFAGAAEAGKEAFNKLALEATGLDDAIAVVTTAVEATTEAFSGVVDEIADAIETSNAYVDAQAALEELQADLIVQNAELNKELETQKKISEDTTRSFEERKIALDAVNAANEQLADNAVKLAQAEENTLKLGLELATTDAERREIQIALAEATAARIEAEQQAEIVRLESAQLNRELDEEEKQRLKDLKQLEEDAAAAAIEDETQKTIKLLEIARDRAVKEAEIAGASAETLANIRKQYNDQITAIDEKGEEDRAATRKQALNDGLRAAGNLVSAFQSLNSSRTAENEAQARKRFETDKKLGIAGATINTALAVADALAKDATFPGSRFIAATAAGIAGAAQVTAIKNTEFESGGQFDDDINAPNLEAQTLQQNFTQAAGADIDITGGIPPAPSYVLATDVSNAQEAQQQINNLARL